MDRCLLITRYFRILAKLRWSRRKQSRPRVPGIFLLPFGLDTVGEHRLLDQRIAPETNCRVTSLFSNSCFAIISSLNPFSCARKHAAVYFNLIYSPEHFFECQLFS